MSARLPTFDVDAKVTLVTTISIPAADFADALERAKSLNVLDFIAVKGEHNDSEFDVIGVSRHGAWHIDRPAR